MSRQRRLLLYGRPSINAYLMSLNNQGLIAAMYLPDTAAQATYTGTLAGTIVRNAGYTLPPGATVVANGGFTADTNWTKGAGWTISGGAAHSDGSQAADSNLSQAAVLTATNTYLVTFTISNYSAGNIRPVCGTALGTNRSANGAHTEHIIGNGTGFALRADLDFIGDVDNVSVQKVGALDAAIGWTTPWVTGGGLSFDGLTSFLRVLNNSALANLTAQAVAVLGTWTGLGEGDVIDKGTFYIWQTLDGAHHLYEFYTNNADAALFKTTGTSALSISNAGQAAAMLNQQCWSFMDFDNANVLGNGRRIRLHHGVNGVVTSHTLSTNNAGTGTVAAMSTDLYLGNDGTFAHTLVGTLDKAIVFNGNALPTINTILANLTALAGV